MSVFPGPINRLKLSFECSEHVVRVILDNVISDWITVGPSFGPDLNKDLCHSILQS